MYNVKFEDKEGNIKKTTIKTSLFSGVYKTDEKIIKPSNRENLKAENARLKQEIEQLKKKKKKENRFF